MADMHSPAESAASERGGIWTTDRWLWRVLGWVCAILMLLTVIFTCYTVYMRYVVGDPPFWGDTVALFANIWMVLLALAISVRTRDQIAMQALYSRIAPAFGFWLEVLWTSVILVFAVFLIFIGGKAAMDVPGQFWELGELSKTYPMLILPVCGVFVTLAAVAVLAEDYKRWRRGDLTVMNSVES